jgi:copper chaperone CopZ
MRIFFIMVLVCIGLHTHAKNNKAYNHYPPTDTIATALVKVKGITCATDLGMISNNVKKLKGINDCKPGKQGTTTTFEVSYNPLYISLKEIYQAIEGTGSCEHPDERPYKIKQ